MPAVVVEKISRWPWHLDKFTSLVTTLPVSRIFTWILEKCWKILSIARLMVCMLSMDVIYVYKPLYFDIDWHSFATKFPASVSWVNPNFNKKLELVPVVTPLAHCNQTPKFHSCCAISEKFPRFWTVLYLFTTEFITTPSWIYLIFIIGWCKKSWHTSRTTYCITQSLILQENSDWAMLQPTVFSCTQSTTSSVRELRTCELTNRKW